QPRQRVPGLFGDVWWSCSQLDPRLGLTLWWRWTTPRSAVLQLGSRRHQEDSDRRAGQQLSLLRLDERVESYAAQRSIVQPSQPGDMGCPGRWRQRAGQPASQVAGRT